MSDGSQLIYGSSGIFIPRQEIGYILVGGAGSLAYCSVTDLLSDSILFGQTRLQSAHCSSDSLLLQVVNGAHHPMAAAHLHAVPRPMIHPDHPLPLICSSHIIYSVPILYRANPIPSLGTAALSLYIAPLKSKPLRGSSVNVPCGSNVPTAGTPPTCLDSKSGYTVGTVAILSGYATVDSKCLSIVVEGRVVSIIAGVDHGDTEWMLFLLAHHAGLILKPGQQGQYHTICSNFVAYCQTVWTLACGSMVGVGLVCADVILYSVYWVEREASNGIEGEKFEGCDEEYAVKAGEAYEK
ncbi:uncharacterized protein BO96DRAFT_324545 [Aspergillus niger CBS 101883]|uniref:Uncharacterized protein n=3 Tax=Aspergillus niger TaxID=5061 RepID=A2QX74_ASPNC|nr:uncharacterized protein BO96DRAFT_324545 [Aspergillus niger CBS 101883]XP_059604323.1 hypothetical protein An11g07880 [Aspergillus niger]PYH61785.1 hypothetical protein BO96DRAFT_324545 [Aspergillus niger CBS 101883]RDH16410.1 hypothetical protein M747DRAFT_245071 [Aspergillus niger ATCC 13496]CAK45982.1 hypothetical protein An11g07880 [Aspergillus niger]